jgi:hypothetical protein
MAGTFASYVAVTGNSIGRQRRRDMDRVRQSPASDGLHRRRLPAGLDRQQSLRADRGTKQSLVDADQVDPILLSAPTSTSA